MKKEFLFAAAVGALVCMGTWGTRTDAASAFFTGIGDLPGGDYLSTAVGVSADGSTVVGYSSAGPTYGEAIRWTQADGIVGLGHLPQPEPELDTYYASALATSADGSVIVGFDLDAGDAFRWTESEGMVSLGNPTSNFPPHNFAYDVSGDGSIVVGEAQTPGSSPFRWTQDSGMLVLPGLPELDFSIASGISSDGTTIVGGATFEDLHFQAYRWTEDDGFVRLGYLTDGPSSSNAEDISADNQVIVGASGSSNGGEAYRWTEAEGMVGLGDLPGGSFHSQALAVTAGGATIVGYGTTDNGFEPFIWDQAHGMRNLREVLINEYGLGDTLADWTFGSDQVDISADGRVIVGIGKNPDGQTEGWVVRLLPEPCSSLLLMLGSAALIVVRRR